MATSPATLLVVSHDRRLLETVCDRLWVVGDGSAVPFDGGYRAWRAAIASGWTVAGALASEAARLHGRARTAGSAGRAVSAEGARPLREDDRPAADRPAPSAGAAPRPPRRPRREKLSKDAYRRQKAAAEAELTRLGLRKNHLELSMADPIIQANFIELRRVTSELADIDVALAAAEDAWLELEERAP
jgi:ATP-binding cassette subfamily F protein 3